MNTNKGYFFCYSYDLAGFIINKGIRYITIAKDTRTNKTFTLFKHTNDLKKAIEEYNCN